jgi:hypothetical protein
MCGRINWWKMIEAEKKPPILQLRPDPDFYFKKVGLNAGYLSCNYFSL